MCQAHTAARYFLVTPTDTGLKGIKVIELMARSLDKGSDTAHSAKECRSSNEAGRWSGFGIEIYRKRGGICKCQHHSWPYHEGRLWKPSWLYVQ
jgi:hypothetical protein